MTDKQKEEIEGWEHLVSGVENQVKYYEEKLADEKDLLENFKQQLQEARDEAG